jgi:hypothetical protein
MTFSNKENAMQNDNFARLDPVYRALDDQQQVIAEVMPALSRYSEEVSDGGRFDADVRARIGQACAAAARQLTFLLAVFRDVQLLDVDAPRVVVDLPAGSARVGDAWGETSLSDELRLFLHEEGERAQRLLHQK